MLPCADMSLLAVNCVPPLHSWGCREHGWLAGGFCHHPGGQLGEDLCLPCSPSLSRCSQPAAPRVHSCKMWEHQCQTKPSSFQRALTVQTTKRWRWCGAVRWTSLWDLMKPRNIRGEKDRKKWRKREARQKMGDVIQRSCVCAWAEEQSPSPACLGKEVAVTSPDAGLLQRAWAELWWMSIHRVRPTLLAGTWWALTVRHSRYDKFCTQKMRPADWNEISLHDARMWLFHVSPRLQIQHKGCRKRDDNNSEAVLSFCLQPSLWVPNHL